MTLDQLESFKQAADEESRHSVNAGRAAVSQVSTDRKGWNFPIASAGLAFAKQARVHWLERHQNAFNFWIHLIGIPLTLAGIPLLFVEWYWGLGAILLGYLLQWIGHQVEGNDVGEFIPIKKLLGLPYVAIAPRRNPPAATH